MQNHTSPRVAARSRSAFLGLAGIALAFTFAACGPGAASAIPTGLPGDLSSMEIPTFPPDDMASGTAACIDAPTMAIIDQLRAPGADVPALLAANKDALLTGLANLESSDPAVESWRDALLTALTDDDMTAAAAQVAVLAADQVSLTPC
ncbi:MAG TPA: hypothetical protein VFP56_00550 [Candidatus Limnocylindrales bacterium]|nr:hypothetical protein [Candidatus Limnocylindrales bacterium]